MSMNTKKNISIVLLVLALLLWLLRKMNVLYIPGLSMVLLGLLAVALFVVLSAAVGLVLGVLMPSFHWTSETAVIKQSPFCLLAMLLSWGAALALFAGTAALSHRMPPAVSLSLACLLLAGADALALRWLKTKGAARFETT